MRQILILAFPLFASAVAHAADIPARLPTMPPAAMSPLHAEPATTWQGFYAGLHVGTHWGNAQLSPSPAGLPSSIRFAGVAVGGLAGYNHAFGQAVAGLEGEVGGSRALGTSFFAGAPAAADQGRAGGIQARARVRAGYRIGNALIFAAGGVTLQREALTLATVAPAPAQSHTIAKTRTGWNIGLGVDYAIAPHWISRAEYIHDHFGARPAGFAALPGSAIASRRVQTSAHTLRLAVIYKFGEAVRRDTAAPLSVLY